MRGKWELSGRKLLGLESAERGERLKEVGGGGNLSQCPQLLMFTQLRVRQRAGTIVCWKSFISLPSTLAATIGYPT